MNFLELENLEWKCYNLPHCHPSAILGTFLKIELIIQKQYYFLKERKQFLWFAAVWLSRSSFYLLCTVPHYHVFKSYLFFFLYPAHVTPFQESALCLFWSAATSPFKELLQDSDFVLHILSLSGNPTMTWKASFSFSVSVPIIVSHLFSYIKRLYVSGLHLQLLHPSKWLYTQ